MAFVTEIVVCFLILSALVAFTIYRLLIHGIPISLVAAQRKIREAEKRGDLESALVAAKNSGQAYAVVLYLEILRRWQELETYCSEVLERDESVGRCYYGLARCYTERGDYDGALDVLRKGALVSGDVAEAYIKGLIERARFREAKQALSQAQQQFPNLKSYESLTESLATAEIVHGRRTALLDDPVLLENSRSVERARQALDELRPREALEILDAIPSSTSSPPLGYWHQRAYAMQGLRRWDEAIECFRRLIADDESSFFAHLSLARCLANRNLIEEALEHYRIAAAFQDQWYYGNEAEFIERLCDADRYSEASQRLTALLRNDQSKRPLPLVTNWLQYRIDNGLGGSSC